MRAGTFGSIAPSHAFSGGEFGRAGTGMGYGGHFGNGYGGYGNRYGNYFGRGGYGGYGGWGVGLDWGYPYDYGYYYPDAGDYYYSYAPTSYASAGAVAVVDPVITATQQLSGPSEIATTTSADAQQGADEALQFYSEARAAFLQGDYQNALRLGCHAAVDAPRNPKVHELISLALFALRNYPAAASEAHAAMALGSIADWKDLFGYYNDAENYTAQLGALEVAQYTTQLRALEKASANNPRSAAEHFLLGYHYLMTGARNKAERELAAAAKLTPGDKLAVHYLQELRSNTPLTPPQMASKPQGTAL